MKTWTERIKQHALTHYTEDGWDILVECWPDEYIQEHFRGCKTYEEAVSTIGNTLSSLADYRYDIQNA
jgi:hypothetical protein